MDSMTLILIDDFYSRLALSHLKIITVTKRLYSVILGCNGTTYDVEGYLSQYTDVIAVGNRSFHCIQSIEQPKGSGLTIQFDDFAGWKCLVEYLAVGDIILRLYVNPV